MNVVGKISLGLAAALVLNQAVRADDAAPASQDAAAVSPAAGQPYGTIVMRNVFGLVPIPPPPPPPDTTPPPDPPPKITANGIMSIFGQLQALFKVTLPPKPGQQPKETSYMLSEGQRQDDIEVEKINEKAATITFNNHGTEQDIPLVAGQASGSDASPAGAGPSNPQNPFAPRLPRFGGRPPGFPGGSSFGTGGQNPMPQGNNNGFGGQNNNNPAAGLNFGGNSAAPVLANQNPLNLTPEEQVIMIEAERERLKNMSTPPYDPGYLPPTPLTPKGEDVNIPSPR
jgi:hypothetical protein